ncbi:MAG: DNA-directed RNA polymerase subunit omega [bacterium]|nr:MAG: DNA-directed RNA polymerase subunit omega [bacterium]
MKLKTMEGALEAYPNRFQLTMMAAARAKEINQGETPLVQSEDKAKPVVVALEEISQNKIIPADLDVMAKIREARRVLRERALMEARERDDYQAEGEGAEESASAVPAEEPAED